MATRRELRSDILLRVSMGRPSDDLELEERQIDFWLDMARSYLVKRKMDAEKTNFEPYLTYFDCKPITKEEIDCNCPITRYYVALPASVMDMKNDVGVYYVETSGGERIRPMKPGEIERNKSLRFFAKTNTLSYSRVGDRLYITGGNINFLKNGAVNMLLILDDTRDIISDDDEYPISSELLVPLMDYVVQLALQEMGQQLDERNDGEQQINQSR